MASDDPRDLIGKGEKARDDAAKAGKTAVAADFAQFVTDSNQKMVELDEVENDDTKSEEDKKVAHSRTLRWIAGKLVALGTEHGIADLEFAKLDVPSVEASTGWSTAR